MLGVDADNPTGALGVYEANGFAVHRRGMNLRRPMGTAGLIATFFSGVNQEHLGKGNQLEPRLTGVVASVREAQFGSIGP